MSPYIVRLEAALRKQTLNRGEPWVELNRVRCEACGQCIKHYIGPLRGALCRNCAEEKPELHFCGNLTPGDWSGDQDYEITGEP